MKFYKILRLKFFSVSLRLSDFLKCKTKTKTKTLKQLYEKIETVRW